MTRAARPLRPRLVFATRNRGKRVELQELLADLAIDIVSLSDLSPAPPDVVEDGGTFQANASKKAREISHYYQLPALADDSGLEVDALGGAPGVHSARYAGPGATDADNNTKLIAAMTDVPDERRTARFRSCLALADTHGALGPQILTASGTCEGRILRQPRGSGGFGYDPLFLVLEQGATFAELGVATKNHTSHRARAMAAMKPRLIEYFQLVKAGRTG